MKLYLLLYIPAYSKDPSISYDGKYYHKLTFELYTMDVPWKHERPRHMKTKAETSNALWHIERMILGLEPDTGALLYVKNDGYYERYIRELAFIILQGKKKDIILLYATEGAYNDNHKLTVYPNENAYVFPYEVFK
jgi:hypothetical protein